MQAHWAPACGSLAQESHQPKGFGGASAHLEWGTPNHPRCRKAVLMVEERLVLAKSLTTERGEDPRIRTQAGKSLTFCSCQPTAFWFDPYPSPKVLNELYLLKHKAFEGEGKNVVFWWGGGITGSGSQNQE